MNRKPQIAAIGDAGRFLQRLADSGEAAGSNWSDSVAALRARDAEREAEIDHQAAVVGEHVNPVALFRTLEREASDVAVWVADGGDFVGTASYILRPRAPLT